MLSLIPFCKCSNLTHHDNTGKIKRTLMWRKLPLLSNTSSVKTVEWICQAADKALRELGLTLTLLNPRGYKHTILVHY